MGGWGGGGGGAYRLERGSSKYKLKSVGEAFI